MSRKITLSDVELASLVWRKARRSSVNGQCVEVAATAGKMAEITREPEREPSAYERWLDRASRIILATSDFLENIITLLRKFAQLAGLAVVVAACIELAISPHLSLDHLTVPGAGILAILQGFIKPRRQHSQDDETKGP